MMDLVVDCTMVGHYTERSEVMRITDDPKLF